MGVERPKFLFIGLDNKILEPEGRIKLEASATVHVSAMVMNASSRSLEEGQCVFSESSGHNGVVLKFLCQDEEKDNQSMK